MTAFEPKFNNATLSAAYASVLFPFDVGSFLRSLAKRGYFLPDPVARAITMPTPGARLEASGILAKKDEVFVGINIDRKLLAVHATEPEDALREMRSLESLLKDDFGVDSADVAQFYEFASTLTAKAGKSPVERWAAQLGGAPVVQQMAEALGMEVYPFGLRLVPQGKLPTDVEWFEIRAEPQIHSPASHHYIDVVFRHPDPRRVFDFIRDFRQTMDRLVSILEEG